MVDQGGYVFVHVMNEIRIQVVHMVFPDSDDILGGHVQGRVVFGFDIIEQPFFRHFFQS